MFMALGEEPQDDEAVKDAETGQLLPPAGNSSLGGQDTQLDTPGLSPAPPGVTGTAQTAKDWGCSLQHFVQYLILLSLIKSQQLWEAV